MQSRQYRRNTFWQLFYNKNQQSDNNCSGEVYEWVGETTQFQNIVKNGKVGEKIVIQAKFYFVRLVKIPLRYEYISNWRIRAGKDIPHMAWKRVRLNSDNFWKDTIFGQIVHPSIKTG